MPYKYKVIKMDKKNEKKKSGSNMEVEKVKELIDLMKANDITEMEITDGALLIYYVRNIFYTTILCTDFLKLGETLWSNSQHLDASGR